MSRRKRTHKCYTCNNFYTHETGRTNADGTFTVGAGTSTRAVIVGTNRVHNCKAADNIAGDKTTPYTPAPIPAPVSPVQTPDEVYTDALDDNDYTDIVPTPDTTPDAPKTLDAGKVLDDYLSTLSASERAIYNVIKPAIDIRIDEIADAVAKQQSKTVLHRVEVIRPDGTIHALDNAHRQMAKLIQFASIRAGKEQSFLNIMLVGPAGTGKTTAAAGVADFLGLTFRAISVGPQSTKSDFFGYTDAHGVPQWTVIRDAYVNGGVLLIDEMDAATAGAMTYLNSILANDKCSFPVGATADSKTQMFAKHKDLLIIAGTNTYGKGASNLYNSREQLDGATLDRFVGIDWDYDTDMEMRLVASHHSSSNPLLPEVKPAPVSLHASLPWVDFIFRLRRAQNDCGLRLIYGTRKIIYGAAMLDAGVSRAEVEAATVWFGVSDNEKQKLIVKMQEYR
jgi:hypothetical protein